MSRERLGILTALSPFTGLPLSILTWILPVFGVVIFIIAATLHSRKMKVLRAQTTPTHHVAELT
jgi:type IV secretory pathway TrbD component